MAGPALAPPSARSANQRWERRAAGSPWASLKGAVPMPTGPAGAGAAGARGGRHAGSRHCGEEVLLGQPQPCATRQQPEPCGTGVALPWHRLQDMGWAALGHWASTEPRARCWFECHPRGGQVVSSATKPRHSHGRQLGEQQQLQALVLEHSSNAAALLWQHSPNTCKGFLQKHLKRSRGAKPTPAHWLPRALQHSQSSGQSLSLALALHQLQDQPRPPPCTAVQCPLTGSAIAALL